MLVFGGGGGECQAGRVVGATRGCSGRGSHHPTPGHRRYHTITGHLTKFFIRLCSYLFFYEV